MKKYIITVVYGDETEYYSSFHANKTVKHKSQAEPFDSYEDAEKDLDEKLLPFAERMNWRVMYSIESI